MFHNYNKSIIYQRICAFNSHIGRGGVKSDAKSYVILGARGASGLGIEK